MAICDFGDSKVTVNKKNLLAKIRENREKHEAEYKEALAGYRVAVIEELTRKLAQAKENKDVQHHVESVRPTEHLKEYDRVITMLEMSVSEEIIITETQLSQYVLDEWNWQGAFKATNARYSGRI